MKKLLVPIDFTPSSRNATEYAAALAKVFAAEIHLLHVYMEPMPVGNVPDYQASLTTSLRTENASRVNKEIEWVQERCNIRASGHTLAGFKGDTINDAASELNADLLVMGVKSARKNRILGSTTLKMIRKSNKPLLLIPEAAPFRPMKNIVLAVDFNEMISRTGMDVFFTLVKQFDAAVRVLHVQKTSADMKASEAAEKLQMGQVLSGISYQYDPLGANDVNEGILNFLDTHPADLLVMIAHHHGVLERLFNPVHTGAISAEVKLPLLVLKVQHLFE